MSRIELDELPSKERARVERALHPHDHAVTVRTRRDWADEWRAAAQAADKTFVAWVEEHLNAALKRRRR